MPNSPLPRILTLILLAACEGEDGPLAPHDNPEDVTKWTVAGRHVAIFNKTPDEPCPAATHPSWSGEPLFRSGEMLVLLKDEKLPTPLERFCSYTWLDKDEPADKPTFDAPWNKRLIRIDPDREVVVPQTPYLGGDAATRDTLAEAFRQYSGTLGSGAASQVYQQTETAAWVAVIDSAGFADAALPYASADPWLRHGLTMAELVHAVRCPNDEKDCSERQFHAQAFPYDRTSTQVQASGGGPLGSIGSLAQALGEAVIRWRALDQPDAPLILNLSVAWDPTYGGDLMPPGQEGEPIDMLEAPSDRVPATVQAVYAVLVYASCHGALTIAASGNNTGAPCEQQGAMAPALWERYPAPHHDACFVFFGEDPDQGPGDPTVEPAADSLVYAAGGVTAYDLPIPVARPVSTPPRVLPAFQAVAGAGPRQTDAWTGTSVAAAALSGLAASIWTHHPALTPRQVIGLITSSGRNTGLPVAPPATGQARLITGYDAFASLCTRLTAGECTNPYLPATPPTQASPEIYMSNPMPAELSCTATATSCGASVSVYGCGEDGTAETNVPAPSPWLRPQPDIPYCPVCPIKGNKLTLSLNPDHSAGTSVLDNPTLEFRLANGNYVRARLGQITVGPNGTDVDLAGYNLTVGNTTQSIAAWLSADDVTSATLGFYIDVDGVRTRSTSAVPVSR